MEFLHFLEIRRNQGMPNEIRMRVPMTEEEYEKIMEIMREKKINQTKAYDLFRQMKKEKYQILGDLEKKRPQFR